MPRTRSSAAAATHRTQGLIVRRAAFGEYDVIVSLFTEHLGLVSALARGARRSQKRFGGSLEPFHTLSLQLKERSQQELFILEEASISTVRARLVSDLERLDAAGRALSWVRRSAAARTAEPGAWRAIVEFLDRLDAETVLPSSQHHLAAQGLRLLDVLGWGLELTRCVRCGRSCGPKQPATVDARQGGLVCRQCGGARQRLSAEQRERLEKATGGDGGALEPPDVALVLSLVEVAFETHTGTTSRPS